MAILQISKPQLSVSLGRCVSDIFSQIHIIDTAEFQRSCLNIIASQLMPDGLIWCIVSKASADTDTKADVPFSCHSTMAMNAAQIEHWQQLAKILLQDNEKSQYPAEACFIGHCKATGQRHIIFIQAGSDKHPISDDPLTEYQKYLQVLGPQLLKAHSLHLFNHALQYSQQFDYGYAIYDTEQTLKAQSKTVAPDVPLGINEAFHINGLNISHMCRHAGYYCLETLSLPKAFATFTDKEKKIAFFVGKAKTNKAIARALKSSEKTIENQLTAIYSKLNIHSRALLICKINSA